MGNILRRGLWRLMLPIPEALWQKRISAVGRRIEAELAFMEEDHRRVHHFVVRELPRIGRPLPVEFVSENLDISVERVAAILDELDSRMLFLLKNSEGSVLWAYPGTAEKTPHHVTFSTGEKIYAA
ncbi:MAG: hypothetical protein OEM19_00885 [Deltaproteobacteria bacterium]|nr:hypothetical protein [Deltaproteobacteria bacterium]